MYIGTQKILKENPLEDKVKVTLEASPLDELEAKTEEQIYLKETLDKLKTKEPNEDLTKLKDLRCEKTVGELLMVLLNNNVRIDDLEYILRTVNSSIHYGQRKKDRIIYGNHETKRTIGQFSDQLLGN